MLDDIQAGWYEHCANASCAGQQNEINMYTLEAGLPAVTDFLPAAEETDQIPETQSALQGPACTPQNRTERG